MEPVEESQGRGKKRSYTTAEGTTSTDPLTSLDRRRRKDAVWSHVRVTGKNKFECNYCRVEYGGGATRIKNHLGIDGRKGGIKKCPDYPPEPTHNVGSSRARETQGPSSESLVARHHQAEVNQALCLFTGDEGNISEAHGNLIGGQMKEQNIQHVGKRAASPFPEIHSVGSEFEENAMKLLGWLKNPQACTIGVWGMVGVGKTALLRYIHNEVFLSKSVYWMNASQCDNVYNWQRSIATCFGLDLLEEAQEIIRSAKLYSSLVQLGDIVLILDDVRKAFSAHEVGLPLGRNGWKLILSTHSFDVCRIMKCADFVVKVETLSDGDAQQLFINNHTNYSTLTTEVKEEAKRILQLCGGLPLGIITMADCMNEVVDVKEWKRNVDKLEMCQKGHKKDELLSHLQSSYDRLDDKMVQDCFLSSVLYFQHIGQEYSYRSMSKKKLISLWIQEGLLDEILGKEKQIREGHWVLNKLLNSCLLKVSSPNNEEVTIHHLVGNMAIQYANENDPGFRVSHLSHLEQFLEDDEQWGADLVKVLMWCVDHEEIQMIMPPRFIQVKVMVFQGVHSDYVVPNTFFLYMKALRVLDFSFMEMERLPNSVSELTNLRVLLLHCCQYLKYMPSVEKLTKLKVLDVSSSFAMKEAPAGIETLKRLDLLSYNWNVSDLDNFNKLVDSWQFSSLLDYNLVLHDEEYEEDCSNLFTREMSIIGVDLDQEKDKTILLPPHLEELRIHGCNMNWVESLEYALPSFIVAQDLKKLDLDSCEGIKYILSRAHQEHSSFHPFRTLEDLAISSLIELEEIIKICESIDEDGIGGRNCEVSLPSLKALHLSYLPKLVSVFRLLLLCTSLRELDIDECEKIKEVFRLQLLQNQQTLFSNLQTIEVSDCGNLEVIFDSSNNGTNSILVLPNLRTFKLKKLPRLGSIYRGILLCTGLEEIIIEDCPRYQQMEQLSKPVICDCSETTLISIPTFDNNEGYWEPLRNYPNDKSLISNEAVAFQRNREQSSGAAYGHQMSSQPIVNTAGTLSSSTGSDQWIDNLIADLEQGSSP